MKQFIVDRHTTPNTPTLEQVPTEKIPVYEDMDAAAADLANLAENQIIATHDTGSELSAPVDTVQSGNMHAVTSNAVAGALAKMHYYHTTFTGSSVNDWHYQDIFFDKTYKYPPLVTVTTHDGYISDQSITYWQQSLQVFIEVFTTKVRIAYYVRDTHSVTYDVNVYGEVAD